MSAKTPDAIGVAWQDLYAAALLELDPKKLPDRIKASEQAIAARFVALDRTHDGDEAQRLTDAMNNLSVLRREANAA